MPEDQSGIGGGVVSGGHLLAGRDGYAAEFGHVLVNSTGARCQCGSIGCLETEVNFQRLARSLGLGSSSYDLDRVDRSLAEVTAAENPAAREFLSASAEVERQLGFLDIALSSTINVFNPSMIVLGGFLGSLHAAGKELGWHRGPTALPGARDNVTITGAALGSDLLLVGAAEPALAPALDRPDLWAAESATSGMPAAEGRSG